MTPAMATGTGGFETMSNDVLELVLARLPVTDLLAAAQVCKHWSAVARAREFVELYDARPLRRPWFFQCCVDYLCPAKSQCHGFDPETRRWHLVSPECFPPSQGKALAGSVADSVYSIFGVTELSYKRQFLSAVWERAPAPRFSRAGPLLGVLEGSCRLVVAGGVSFFEDDDLAVEMYDAAAAAAWEQCPSMPSQFRGNGSRHWMTSAVAGGRFFVAEIHSGATAAFDAESRAWSGVQVLRPPGALHSHLLASRGGLVLAASCCMDGASAFRIWAVDEARMDCGPEVARMPADMCALFVSREDGRAPNGEGLRCAASGSLIYVFFPLSSREQSHENQVAVCDLSRGGSGSGGWSLLPPLPDGVSFNHAVGFSSRVTIKALLGQG